MNGAESLIKTLVDSGVDVCFTNPGTSEMHFVAALDEVEGMRSVLCLFEGTVSGAAAGYAAIARKPAATLLHLGPGFGNALANVHNAKKGDLPMINIIGDHATYHVQYDAPLTSDIKGIASPVSHWYHSSARPDDIGRDAATAVEQAGRGYVATLVLPADVSWSDNPNGPSRAASLAAPGEVSGADIERAATMLRAGKNTVVMIGGRDVTAAQLDRLSQIAQATGARIMTDTFPARVRRGAGIAPAQRLSYLAELATQELAEVEQLILLGAAAPISFFAYPKIDSVLTPEQCDILPLAGPNDAIDGALDDLVKALDAESFSPIREPLVLPDAPTGELSPQSVAQSIAHYLPQDAIVVDEGITSGMAVFPETRSARAHDWLNQTGGAIGWGLPAAVGASIAAPERKVLCLEGDGSAMYTIQALWTMAREQLDITVVLFNNRKYSILEVEFARTGARGGKPGPKAASSLSIDDPAMDFTAMAQGMGMSAATVTTIEEFNQQLAQAMSSPGPRLIDVHVPPLDLGW